MSNLNDQIMRIAQQTNAPTVSQFALADVQFVSLLAVQRPDLSPAEAVAWAVDLYARAFLAGNPAGIMQKAKEIQESE